MKLKNIYKRIGAVILAAAMLPMFPGCRRLPEGEAAAFTGFTEAIAAGDYASAFEMLSYGSRTEPTPTPEAEPYKPGRGETMPPETPLPTETPLSTAYIGLDEFTERYKNIFGALEISSSDYELKGIEKDGDRRVATYTATYHSALAGDLTNEYEMTLVPEGDQWRVEWSPALIFPDMDWGDTVRTFKTAARRGDIVASGELLAQTVSTWAVKGVLAEIPDRGAFADSVSQALGLEKADVLEKLDSASGEKALIFTCNEGELSGDVREMLDNTEGAELDTAYGTGRIYPQGELMAHTVGYIGYASEKEAERLNEGRTVLDGLYNIHSLIGKSGIEAAYETELRGRDGFSVVIRNSLNETKSTVYERPVENGLDVYLTVDMDMQRRAEEVFGLVLWGDDTSGAAIAMDPKTGEIKCMVSYPSYDLNKLAVRADADYYKQLMEQKNTPMQNRATLGLYPPGSAIKPFTAAAAIEQGFAGPDYIFTGTIEDDYWTPTQYGRWVWPPIKRTKLKKRTEPMNMANCLLHSDNIYFANLALMMGEDAFLGYLRGLGFEQDFPFDLSVLKSTLKVRSDSELYWNTRSIAETGYGQGQTTVTPIQLASLYCAFRNGGDVPVPRITAALYKTNGIKYEPVKEYGSRTWISGALKQSTIDILEPMMEDIMRSDLNGTGKKLRARGCTAAGKTGTAEIGSDKSREISWFVGYRVGVEPEDELLVLVVLEIPTADAYKYLKFDIARELISTEPAPPLATEEPDPTAEPTEEPAETPEPNAADAPEETPAATDAPAETTAPAETDGPTYTEAPDGAN